MNEQHEQATHCLRRWRHGKPASSRAMSRSLTGSRPKGCSAQFDLEARMAKPLHIDPFVAAFTAGKFARRHEELREANPYKHIEAGSGDLVNFLNRLHNSWDAGWVFGFRGYKR